MPGLSGILGAADSLWLPTNAHPDRGMIARPLRVLFLNDDPADAEMVAESLSHSGMALVTERVDSPDAFTQALREFAPDVVLSGDALEKFDAYAALEVMHDVRPTAALIVLAGAVDRYSAATFVRAGAEDFVLKTNLHRLAATIECALSVRRPLEKLTPRQLEVLRLMAAGLTTPEIARRLNLSGKTIETHRGEIMKRVGIHDLVGLVRYAVRVGLVSPQRSESAVAP